MKQFGWPGCAVAVLLAATTMTVAAQQSPRALFERARVLEENPRTLDRAVGLYEQVVKLAGSDRTLAGNARLRIGAVRERQGRREAREVYSSVLRDYRDVPNVVNVVTARLAALNGQAGSETPARLIGTPGFEEAFDMSADGRFVVGPERRGYNGYDVVLRDLQSGETRVLGTAFQSRISRDGSRVAFGCPNAGSRALCVVGTAPGSSPQPVLDMPTGVDVVPVDWHPSGNLMLVALRGSTPTAIQELAWLSLADRSLKTIRAFEPWQVPGRTMLSASISPDGRFIAFTMQRSRESADFGLYVIGNDGQNETTVINAAGAAEYPVWMPDGGHVLFTGDVGGVRGLWALAVQEGRAIAEPRLVKRELGAGAFARPLGVTTTGTLIYKRTDGNLNYSFVSSRAPAGGSRVASFVGIHAAWSANGLAAFLREGDEVDLVIRDMATGVEKRYRRRGLDFQHDLVWLPDASGVLVYAQDETPATRGIYLFDTRLETFRKLMDVGGTGRWRKGSFTVSHDGTTLYVPVSEVGWEASAPVSGVAAVDIRTGEERLLVSFPAASERPANVGLDLSPDGKTLAVSARAAKSQSVRILAVGVDDGTVREVTAALATGWVGDSTRWTPDGQNLLVVSFDSNRDWRIVRIPAAGGEPVFDGLDYRALAAMLPDLRLAPGNFNGFDISPDGSQLIVSTWTLGKHELWAIDNVMTAIR